MPYMIDPKSESADLETSASPSLDESPSVSNIMDPTSTLAPSRYESAGAKQELLDQFCTEYMRLMTVQTAMSIVYTWQLLGKLCKTAQDNRLNEAVCDSLERHVQIMNQKMVNIDHEWFNSDGDSDLPHIDDEVPYPAQGTPPWIKAVNDCMKFTSNPVNAKESAQIALEYIQMTMPILHPESTFRQTLDYVAKGVEPIISMLDTAEMSREAESSNSLGHTQSDQHKQEDGNQSQSPEIASNKAKRENLQRQLDKAHADVMILTQEINCLPDQEAADDSVL